MSFIQTKDEILAAGKAVISMEAGALVAIAARLGDAFVEAAQSIFSQTQGPDGITGVNTGGRLVVSGIGKSAIIGQKIVATMNSTGTPALFMHAADAIHGDLGMIRPADMLLFLSKSGETEEMLQLVPLIKKEGLRIISIVGNPESTLARQSDFALDAAVEQEADAYNLAPTTSSTAALALGDALAVTLLQMRGFTATDFARYHPGGTLGRRLTLTVADLAHSPAPSVSPKASLQEVILAISRGRVGATLVCDERGSMLGIITDGDLRRLLEKTEVLVALANEQAEAMMSRGPKTIAPATLAYDALQLMERFSISQLVVVTEDGFPAGIVHFHDLLAQGIR